MYIKDHNGTVGLGLASHICNPRALEVEVGSQV
jgi:hypothetical protein